MAKGKNTRRSRKSVFYGIPGHRVNAYQAFIFGFDARRWARSGQWLIVESSNVASVRYDEKNQELQVRFRSGWLYTYRGVGMLTAMDFFTTSSVGGHVWKRLRDAGVPFTKQLLP